MASQGDQPRAESGIELTTLVISALASAVAAYITSKIWAPGTLFSAAMSPVIVALVKEGLRKPTEVVAQAVPTVVPTPARWSRTSASDPGLVVDPGPEPPEQAPRVDPDAPHVVLPPVVAVDHSPVRIYSTRARRLRWRLAVITGLLGFAICVVLYTVPELISGKSIGRSSGEATTLWGGHRNNTKKSETTTQTTKTTSTTPTTTDETKTVTQTQTVTTPTETQATTPSSATPAPAATPSSSAPPTTTVP